MPRNTRYITAACFLFTALLLGRFVHSEEKPRADSSLTEVFERIDSDDPDSRSKGLADLIDCLVLNPTLAFWNQVLSQYQHGDENLKAHLVEARHAALLKLRGVQVDLKLLESLSVDNKRNRVEVALLLSSHSESKMAYELLLQMLEDEDFGVSMAAVESLKSFMIPFSEKESRLLTNLFQKVGQGKSDVFRAIYSRSAGKETLIIPFICEQYNAHDNELKNIRHLSVELVCRSGQNGLDSIASILRGEQSKFSEKLGAISILENLGEIAILRLKTEVRELLKSDNPWLRRKALVCIAICKKKDDETLSVVSELAGDTDLECRTRAKELLTRFSWAGDPKE